MSKCFCTATVPQSAFLGHYWQMELMYSLSFMNNYILLFFFIMAITITIIIPNTLPATVNVICNMLLRTRYARIKNKRKAIIFYSFMSLSTF